MASHECGHRRFPTNMPLADSPHRGHRGRTCQWRGAVLGGRAGPRGATRSQRGVVAAG
jgi:hypothetical protein